MKEVWVNLRSLAMAIVTVATVASITMAVIYLFPLLFILLLGGIFFVFYKLMLTEID